VLGRGPPGAPDSPLEAPTSASRGPRASLGPTHQRCGAVSQRVLSPRRSWSRDEGVRGALESAGRADTLASMHDPNPAAESWTRCLLSSARLGALAGASVGAAECAKLLLRGAPRYADLAAEMVAVGVLGYLGLGLLLGAGCGALAWFLWRRPGFVAAPASSCAGVGTLLGMVLFVLTPQVGAALLLPAALLGTVLALCLRELLGRVDWPGRPRSWLACGALLLLVGALRFAIGGGASAGAGPSAPAPAGKPNVLLVTIDTLRADHVGAYGASGARTPAIDALAQQGVRFADATSQANTTGPSHTTMLTGLYPHDHGARLNGVPIAHGVVTLPEMLAQAGYQTAAAVSGFTLKQEACGLAPRFERYDDELIAWRWMPEVAARLRLFQVAIQLANQRGQRALRADRPAAECVDSSLEWLASRDRERPFFLWTHFYDPHCPYQPPAPFDALHDPDFQGARARNWYGLSTRERRELVGDAREVEHMRALYRGEISYADSELGRLLEALKHSGDFENTLVILTSDHGEGLGEHDYWFDHGTFLYDAELAVPLILRFPRAQHAGRVVDSQVRLLDLTPTVLELLGLAPPKPLSGSSLLAALEGDRDPRPSFAQGEMAGELSSYELGGRLLSLRTQGRKLIWSSDYWLDSARVPERLELFDLADDPGEKRNLWDDAAPTSGAPASGSAQEMRAHVEAWRELTEAGSARGELAPEVRAQLESIGYL